MLAGQTLAVPQAHLSSTMVHFKSPSSPLPPRIGPQPQLSFGPQRISVCTYGLLRHCCVVLRALLGGLAPRQFPTVALERGFPVPSIQYLPEV